MLAEAFNFLVHRCHVIRMFKQGMNVPEALSCNFKVFDIIRTFFELVAFTAAFLKIVKEPKVFFNPFDRSEWRDTLHSFNCSYCSFEFFHLKGMCRFYLA